MYNSDRIEGVLCFVFIGIVCIELGMRLFHIAYGLIIAKIWSDLFVMGKILIFALVSFDQIKQIEFKYLSIVDKLFDDTHILQVMELHHKILYFVEYRIFNGVLFQYHDPNFISH